MDFFSLGEVFIGIGMGLGLGEVSPNTFGNMQHPNVCTYNMCYIATAEDVIKKIAKSIFLKGLSRLSLKKTFCP